MKEIIEPGQERRVMKEVLKTFKVSPAENEAITKRIRQIQAQAAMRGERPPSESAIYRAAIGQYLGVPIKADKKPGRMSEALKREG